MMGIRMTRRMPANPEQVFAACTDFAHAAETISAITKMEMLTDGPVGIGTRFRETRKMFGKEASEVMEITAFDPPHGYVLAAASHGCRYRTEFRFDAVGSETEVSMIFEGKAESLMARLMVPLGWLFKGAMKKCVAQDLDDIADSVAARHATA